MRLAALSVTLALVACSGGGGSSPSASVSSVSSASSGSVLPLTAASGAVPDAAAAAMISKLGKGKIKHVLIVVQENRTFDNLFHGFPGADTASKGKTHTGAEVPLTAGDLEEYYDLGHTHANFETEYDGGKNDGFDEVATSPSSSDLAPYQYVKQAEVQPYFDIASEFTIADKNFASQNGPSFPGHEYLIAGQDAAADDDPSDVQPWGCDAPPGTTVPVYAADGSTTNVFPCFDYQTLGDSLDAASLSWRYYTTVGTGLTIEALPDPYDAVKHIREGADWNNDTVTPSTRILNDIASGNLATVSWVNSPAAASDHPELNDGHGPSWIASIVNAVGNSAYYDDTAIFVTWDDWGGFYDHVVPTEYSVLGTGFRVPLLVISKWSKHGFVSHKRRESTSVITFVESLFGLPSLDQRDAATDDLADCFDFKQTPPAFKPIKLTTAPLDVKRLSQDTRDSDNY
jgi:phospholipase C